MAQNPGKVKDSSRAINKLVLVVNESCNLRCGYCYARLSPSSRLTGRMRPEAARKIIHKFLSNCDQCTFIQFFGGEPTMNLEAIEAAVEETLSLVAAGSLSARPRFGIVTNGVLLDFQGTINLFKKYQIEVTISLDGPAQIHNALRPDAGGAPTYDRVLDTFSAATAAGLPVALETVYTARHVREGFSIVDLFEFFRGLKVVKLLFDSAYPPAPAALNPLLAPYLERVLAYYEDAVDWWIQSLINAEESVFKIYFSDLLLPLLKGQPAAAAEDGCPAGKGDFAVGPDGDVFACQLFYSYADYRTGNVLSGDFPVAAASFPTRAQDISSCRTCFARHWCQPCAALNLFWGDPWEPPEPVCRMRKTVVLRIGRWAFERLEVPENEVTNILRQAVEDLKT